MGRAQLDERESTAKRESDECLALLALLGRHRGRDYLFGPPGHGGGVSEVDLQTAKASEFRASILLVKVFKAKPLFQDSHIVTLSAVLSLRSHKK